MGTRGPIPNRDDQRVRRNKPEVETTTITAIGAVLAPELGFDAHPLVSDLYQSLRDSAQSKYYEASDWAYARLTMYAINDMLTGVNKAGERYEIRNISASKLDAVNTMLSNLLVTEGDRRRVRIEVERKPDGPQATVTSISDIYRDRLSKTN